MRQALGLTLTGTPSNRGAGDDASRRCERASFSSNPQQRRLALNCHRRPTPTSTARSSLPPLPARGDGASAPRRAAKAAAAATGESGEAGKAQTAAAAAAAASASEPPEGLGLDHPAFSPVVSLPLRAGGGGRGAGADGDVGDDDGGEAAPFTTLVVRPLHPSDVRETADALLAAFASDSDPPERPQLERRLAREARRYAVVDPGPWLLHSVSLPPPRAPPPPPPKTAAAADKEEEEEEEEEERDPTGASWASSLHLPGPLRGRRAAALDELAEERAAAAWEEALEDAWGRWLWLVAEARSGDGGGGEGERGGGGGKRAAAGGGRRRKIVGAAAVLFHDRSSSLRALGRLAASELARAPENRGRWPRPDAASMDYCLWLRERFPAAGWPPPSRVGGGGSSPPGSPVSSFASSSSSSALDADAASGSDSSSSEGVFGPCASLWWVGTLPEARGRGVGRALLEASAAVAAAAGFPRLFAQVEEWKSRSGEGGGGAAALRSNRGRRSGGLSGAPWLGSGGGEEEGEASSISSSSSRSSSSPVERMYRSAGFVEVPEPPREEEAGGDRGWGMGLNRRRDDDGGAVDRSAVLLQREIW